MLEIKVNNLDFIQESSVKIASRALVIKDNKVAVLYSKKYNAYITPGGGVEGEETLEQACMREAKEEAGLIVKPLEKIAVLDCNYPKSRIVHHYFVCELLQETNETERTVQEMDQDLVLKWLDLTELKQAYATNNTSFKYDLWMQREFIVIPELRKYMK